MKLKLCVLAMALLGANVWAAEGAAKETSAKPTAAVQPVTKEGLLAELNDGCIKAGNEEKACDCSIKSFQTNITDKEWGLLLTPPKKVTTEDMDAYKIIQEKILKSIDECGANQTKK